MSADRAEEVRWEPCVKTVLSRRRTRSCPRTGGVLRRPRPDYFLTAGVVKRSARDASFYVAMRAYLDGDRGFAPETVIADSDPIR